MKSERLPAAHWRVYTRCNLKTKTIQILCWNLLPKVGSFSSQPRMQPNQSMKPTAPFRNAFSVFATTPARGLSLSR